MSTPTVYRTYVINGQPRTLPFVSIQPELNWRGPVINHQKEMITLIGSAALEPDNAVADIRQPLALPDNFEDWTISSEESSNSTWYLSDDFQ